MERFIRACLLSYLQERILSPIVLFDMEMIRGETMSVREHIFLPRGRFAKPGQKWFYLNKLGEKR
jgi:hypothetical protein